MPPKRPPPKLDFRALQAPPAATRRTTPRQLIDSHIHLYTSEQLESGKVVWPMKDGGPAQLSGAHELADYGRVSKEGIKRVAGGTIEFAGVVFVQAECVSCSEFSRKRARLMARTVRAEHDDSDEDGNKGGWDAALHEIESVCAAALASDVKLLALVPWAPVHHGSSALELYLPRLFSQPSLVALTAKLGYAPIKSFRYLLQDSPKGFFLSDKFLDGLRYLGDKGYAFDMCLDATNTDVGGPLVLEDAVEAIAKVRELQKDGEQTRFMLDHFAKPDLTVDSTNPPSAFQRAYAMGLFSLALLPNVYLKLSALLDSANPELVKEAFANFRQGNSTKSKRKNTGYETLMARILAYLEPAIEAFGESRIVVGSGESLHSTSSSALPPFHSSRHRILIVMSPLPIPATDWPMFRAKTVSASSTAPAFDSPDSADEEAAAWAFEMQLYLDCLVEVGLEGEALDRIYGENAREFYRL
ncbi:SPOSA6832_01243 [Sporobolomyces salmonicolor]|uniref:SPOSA6832_01243-mRNA-1:cds n=1 Tax=Sporidiobolus salmonicolor TaxID=5005 RepID=A0A0D6EJC0_SPOSA|nr:SPOSA6832_01243 [Sporobolomyces salmonicolor]